MKRQRRVPAWVMAVIIIAALPVLAFPFMLSVSATLSGADKYYLWLYPAYILAASFLAWQCYGRRTEMTWIIIILMLLTHVAMWALAGDI